MIEIGVGIERDLARSRTQKACLEATMSFDGMRNTLEAREKLRQAVGEAVRKELAAMVLECPLDKLSVFGNNVTPALFGHFGSNLT